MSKKGTYSIKRLLSYIKDSFNFNDDNWKTDSIEFIGQGLAIIGCDSKTLEAKVSEDTEVVNYRVALPVDMESIRAVEIDCVELPILNSTTLINECKCCVSTDSYSGYGELSSTYLHTSFETGTIKFHYYGIPTDDEGFPLIYNDHFVTEALTWFVIYKLLIGGHKHHTITNWKEAYQMWENLYPQAQNSIKAPDPLQMKVFASWWTNPLNSSNMLPYI